jgi:hypothetical protein
MSYTLLIVESPAKCSKIENFLGPGYKVIGSYGHITHLSSLEQINIEDNYKPSFNIIETKQPQITKIKKAINGSREIILATDDDREGDEDILMYTPSPPRVRAPRNRPENGEESPKENIENEYLEDYAIGFYLDPILKTSIRVIKTDTYFKDIDERNMFKLFNR